MERSKEDIVVFCFVLFSLPTITNPPTITDLPSSSFFFIEKNTDLPNNVEYAHFLFNVFHFYTYMAKVEEKGCSIIVVNGCISIEFKVNYIFVP